MEYWKLRRLKFLNIRLLIYLVSISIFSLCTIFAMIISHDRSLSESRSPFTGKADFHLQTFAVDQGHRQRNGVNITQLAAGGRRPLGGPGSSPPRCISKCGRCTPCRPVHISVPPGTPVTAEYYPETWRCKCGNKLYMP